ncbi:hypothetical protein [Priestia megaterium]|uniref:hypothetical protein n=1 Tax=Priestia megaterium TaxID=1404 RepID=UPI003671CED9
MGKTNRLKSARIIINETLDEKYREAKYEEFLNIAEIMMMNYAENAVKEERKLKQEGKSNE